MLKANIDADSGMFGKPTRCCEQVLRFIVTPNECLLESAAVCGADSIDPGHAEAGQHLLVKERALVASSPGCRRLERPEQQGGLRKITGAELCLW